MIPIHRATLTLWPVPDTDPRHPRLLCAAFNGPVPRDRLEGMKAAGGWERTFDQGERPIEVFQLFEASPGWANPEQAMAVFASIDPDPALRDEMRAAIARRRALVQDCLTWQDAARVLQAAGEMNPRTLTALGLEQ